MPEFHGESVWTYLTSYPLPALPEFDSVERDRNPREAPSIALHEEIRPEMHAYMEDGLLLPSYDSNHLLVKYSKIVAKPGEPLQVHFMVWSQQVLHDMDLPGDQDEFLDLRIELSCNGQIVDVGYINHSSIKPNGLPVGIEFVGQRCGDARETPIFFTLPTNSAEALRESTLNVLVTLGRIGDFIYYDKTKVMSKMVRVGPYHGKYESSTLSATKFTGYVWRKEHQNLIKPDRGINPRTKLYAWKRKWWENDTYRLKVERMAYERCQREWEELEREGEAERNRYAAEFGTADEASIETIEGSQTLVSQTKKVKYISEDSSKSATTVLPMLPEDESPYSFRRARRSDVSNISTISSHSPLSSSPTNKSQHPSSQQPTPPPSATKAQPSGPKSSFHRSSKGVVLTSTVRKGDPQQPSLSNVTFGAFPYKTQREYFREFIPYQDLCRVQYLVVNPRTRELRSGTIELPGNPTGTGARELRSGVRKSAEPS